MSRGWMGGVSDNCFWLLASYMLVVNTDVGNGRRGNYYTICIRPECINRVANNHAPGVTLTLSPSISRSHAHARNVTPK